jgi:MFS family permease
MSLTCIQRLIVFLFPAISTILVIRFIGGVAFSFYTIAFVNLISTQTAAWETGTVLALYTVTIGGLVNIIAAPVAGAIYDAIGAHWLYLLSAIGYGTGGVSLWLTRPEKKAD